jgi:hypothetical protein
MEQKDQKSAFWNSVIRAVEAEPREVSTLKGASGFTHPVVALGVDESRRRVVIISGEPDARSAAMAHADIQAAMPSVKVIMARPAPINLAQAALLLSGMLGKTSINANDLKLLSENSEETKQHVQEVTNQFIDKTFPALGKSLPFVSLNLVAFWKEIIQQLSLIEINTSYSSQASEQTLDNSILRLNKLMAFDPIEIDRSMGVCSFPLYEFQESEVEIFHAGRDIEQVRNILRRHSVFQYFFPAADHLALGLIEGKSASVEVILDKLSQVPSMGHPFGESEIVNPDVKLFEIISVLQEKGLAVEGEVGLVELTPSGMAARATVRFKPREGLLSKLANIISLKVEINLKDLFK